MNRLYKILSYLFVFTVIAQTANAQCDVLITQQPSLPAVVCTGPGSQTLSVTATVKAGGALSYQWYFNGVAITTGGTSATYTIANLQQGSNGEYKVKVSGACDVTGKQDVISNAVNLTLGNTPVLNTTLPDATVCVGTDFFTSASANTRNGGAVSYSWRYMNTDAVVSSAASLSIAGVTDADAGKYRVTVSNTCGVGQSDTISLATRNKPVSAALNNVTTLSACTGQPVVLQTETNNNNGGSVTYAWYKIISGTPVLLPAASGSNYSISAAQSGDAGIYRFLATNSCGTTVTPVDFTVNAPRSKPVIIVQPQSSTVNCADYTLALSVTGSSDAGNISYIWTKGISSLESNAQISYTNSGNTSTLTLSEPTPANNGSYVVSLTNNCGTTQSVPVTVNVDVIKPIITTAPAAHTVCESQSLIENPQISFQSDFNFTYAWYKTGSGVPIASSRELVIPSFADANAGEYKLRVTNTCGTYTESTPVTFSIARKPAITVQPTLGTQIACINRNITISTTANTQGGGTLSYAWYKDNLLIAGQQSANLPLTNMQSDAQGSYRVDVSNQCGVTGSNTVPINLGNLPTLEAKTQDSTYCYGSNITLSITANSNNGGQLSYQWSSSADGALVNTGASLTLNALTSSKTGTYSVQVTNGCGVMSVPAIIVVRGLDKPQITQFTSNATTFCSGNSLNLAVTATSASTMVYNWYQGATPVKANSSDNYYQKGGLVLSDAGTYSVSVSNTCGTSSSSGIAITINGKPTIVTDITKSIDCSGSKSLQLTVAGADNGGGAITYQWYKNGNPLGPNSSTLLINSITSANSGTYYVALSNACGSTNSQSAVVYVNFDVPAIELQPKSGSYCKGQPMLLEVGVKDANSNNFTYQWRKGGADVPGQTQPLFSKDAVVMSDAGQYSVLVTGLCGVATTSNLADILIKDAPSPSFVINSNTTQCLNSNNFEFTDNSNTVGSFVREWIFDDGSTSIIGPGVTHNFNTSGIHNVLLKHTAANGCYGTYSQNITVSSTPIITQQLKSKIACLNGDISLDILVNDNYGGNLSYRWRKNGSVIASANTTSGSYEIFGVTIADKASYSVSVSNSCGTVQSDTISLSISEKPFLTNPVSAQNVCERTIDTVFVSMSSLLPVTKYTWYRNDGFYSNTVSPYLSFPDFRDENSGKFYVEAENACGSTRSNEFAINLKRLPQPGFVATADTVCYRSSRLINAPFSGNLTDSITYQWYRNDVALPGERGSSIFPFFGSAGIYSFSIKATNSCGTVNNLVKTAYVNRIQPQFVVDSIGGCNNNLSVSIQNRTSQAYYPLLSWKALYDDGLEDQLTSATNFVYHKYITSGYFDLKLLAIDSTGCSSDTLHFGVGNYAPTRADFKVTDTCLGSKTIFTNLAQKGAGSFGYDFVRWETSDQVLMDTSASFTLQYQRPGIYTVAMYVRGKNSCITDKIERQVIIAGNPVFAVDSVGGCKNELAVTVTKTGPDHHIRNFLWNIDYGDGTQKVNLDSSFLTDNHRYNKTGTYTVRINTYGSLGCQNTVLEKKVINYGLTRAGFSVKDTCLGYPSIFINNAVKGYNNDRFGSVTWKLDEQLLEDSLPNVAYRFNKAGSYSVTQYVIGENNCQVDSITKPVQIVGNPVFIIDSADGCKNKLTVTVRDANPDRHIRNYTWNVDYGDGYTKNNLDSSILQDLHAYNRAGAYTVRVTSAGMMGCQNQVVTKNLVNYAIAKAAFTVNDTCSGSPNTFINLATKGFGNHAFSAVKWKMGNDWYEDSLPRFTYQLGLSGKYAVTMYVQGDNNCVVDSSTKEVNVIGNPVFVMDSSGSCAGKLMVTVNNTSSSANVKNHFWQIDYGDGYRKSLLDSLLKTDSHTYTTPGTYLVKVNATGNLACQAQSFTRTFTNVAVAKADFSVGDTCLGMPSLFRNTTIKGHGNTGYAFAKWQINGQPVEDTTASVRYTYTTPGTYRVSLAVQGNNSCMVDTISKQFVVIGYPVANFVHKDSCAGFPVFFTDSSIASPHDKIAQWQWNFSDRGVASFAQYPVRTFVRDGSYQISLLVQSATCPQFYDDTTINLVIVRPRPNLRYQTVYTVKNTQNQLDAYPNGRSYEWTPNQYLNNTRVRQPLINPDFTTKEYQVRISDSSGCVNVDTLQVWGFNQPDVYLPTAFSPNQDGYNDVYKAEYVMIDHLEYLKVLDKFNNVIFETKSMTDTWDGLHKGRPMATDVYLVLVSAIDKFNQRIQKKVTVNLLR